MHETAQPRACFARPTLSPRTTVKGQEIANKALGALCLMASREPVAWPELWMVSALLLVIALVALLSRHEETHDGG